MQKNYTYILTKKIGEEFHPDFNPELTPKEMLELGVFGGKYMNDCVDEFPQDWFTNAKLSEIKKTDCEEDFYLEYTNFRVGIWPVFTNWAGQIFPERKL